jgi:competence protein ComEA
MFKWIKEYFELSKKEFNGMVVLCILIFLIALAPEIYSLFREEPKYDYSVVKKEIDAFYASEIKKPKDNKTRSEISEHKALPRYFQFNPNNLDAASWLKLGLSERQVKVIKNFESKGGRFYRPTDLKKIYSISAEEYEKLEPFINIPVSKSYKTTYPKKDYHNGWKPYSKPALVMIELNSADSVQLESLKGIGGAFASRIIKYRKRLGGFVSKEQLLEVYGMDSVKYNAFKDRIALNPGDIKKLSINNATFEDLKRFPYLSYKQINAIIQYRKQHGSYLSITDLKNVLILNDGVIGKIAPYLTF